MHEVKPLSTAAITEGITPFTPLTLPSRLSSPKTTVFLRLEESIIPLAARIPTAIGRSNPVPAFLTSAGDILTTILSGRSSIPEFLIATLTLSFDSLTWDARYPLISKYGSPSPASVSTLTITASSPAIVTLKTSLYIFLLLVIYSVHYQL